MVSIADLSMICRSPSSRKTALASSHSRLAWPRSGSASSCVAASAPSWLGYVRPWERIGNRDPLPGSAIRGDRIPVKGADLRIHLRPVPMNVRPLGSGRRGRRLKSGHSDHKAALRSLISQSVSAAEVARFPDLGADATRSCGSYLTDQRCRSFSCRRMGAAYGRCPVMG